MKLIPLPDYFIVRIDIKKQNERREKIGLLYTHFAEVFMQRNMQQGEVIAIGSEVNKIFPQVEIGDILIFHHFVEGSENEKSTAIYSDETYNYYNVTACDFNGRRNETYAVFKEDKLIPHPDFIFTEYEEKVKEISADEFIEKNTVQVGSLILFSNWEESRESKEEKAKRITQEIKNQGRGKNMRDDVKLALEEKQYEAEKITESLNKTEYTKRKVAAHTPSIELKSEVYSLNIASNTELEIFDKKYIVIPKKYCVATA